MESRRKRRSRRSEAVLLGVLLAALFSGAVYHEIFHSEDSLESRVNPAGIHFAGIRA